MTPDELREEITIELEWMRLVIAEIESLRYDLGVRSPTIREKTAAASFIAQFYGGVENILKRISRFYHVTLPQGDSWHIELFQRFCFPPYSTLPTLFDSDLAVELSQFRKFRHVVLHSYGFQIDWERMREGVFKIDSVFKHLYESLENFLDSID